MIIDKQFKNSDLRFIVRNIFFGIGFRLNCNACEVRPLLFVIEIDFLFIRFWFNQYKPKNPLHLKLMKTALKIVGGIIGLAIGASIAALFAWILFN